MFVIECEFLTGRYVASRWNDRDEPEWPPHPARLFSAIVAACHAGGDLDPLQRSALEWLESLPAPAIVASRVDARNAVSFFVPVNDTAMGSEGPRKQRTVEKARKRMLAALKLRHLLDSGAASEELLPALQAAMPILGKSAKKAANRLERALAAEGNDEEADAARRELAENLEKEVKAAEKGVEENLKEAKASLPRFRPRKERKFPGVTPHDPRVQFVWKDSAPSGPVLASLEQLLSQVKYLGHSSSLVRCAVVSEPGLPTWVPDDAGSEVLRVTGSGQLADLESAHAAHRGLKPRVLPFRAQRYRFLGEIREKRELEPQRSRFSDEWIVFRQVRGPVLSIERAVDVASGLKAALVRICMSSDFIARRRPDARRPVPEAISGLDAEGRPLQGPHVAFAALPFVGHRHADGHLLGVAAILPRSFDGAQRRAVLAALGRVERLVAAPSQALKLRRLIPAITRPFNLEPETWCRTSSLWGTVTPILLDRFPGHLGARDREKALRAEAEAKEVIARACERIGLPRPKAVELVALPPFRGVPAAARFRQPPRKPSRPRRVAVHAVIDFGQLVRGPVLLGAGRYLGLGLCRPLAEGAR
jgi:CRISPR-associated protein Csb2